MLICALTALSLAQEAPSAPDPVQEAQAPSGAAVMASALDGTWLLDLAASDDVRPLLEAQGLGFLEREAAARIQPTHVVQDLGGSLRVRVDSSMGTDDRAFPLDGVPRSETNRRGLPSTVKSWRDGAAVVTESVVTDAQGRAVTTLARRYLDPTGRMVLEYTFTVEGQPPVKVKRVFQRQP